ncbi:MAG: helix-turn-helix domain-containing protein [Nanoarchaeota archaeon]
MDTTALSDLGFTQHEINIYLALLEEGTSTAGKLATKTHLHRRTVYDTLDSLKEKGFISHFEKDGVTSFTTISPERLLDLCKERENRVIQLLPKLREKQNKLKQNNQARVYQGLKAIKNIFEDILSYKEYFAFGEGMKTVEFLGPFFDYFQKEKKRRKINSKILMGIKYKNTKTVTGSYGDFRFLKDYQPPTLTYIYGDNTAIIIWSEIPTAFVIESKEAAEGYKNYFNLLWKIATH